MFITIWFKNSGNSRGKGFTLFCFGYFRWKGRRCRDRGGGQRGADSGDADLDREAAGADKGDQGEGRHSDQRGVDPQSERRQHPGCWGAAETGQGCQVPSSPLNIHKISLFNFIKTVIESINMWNDFFSTCFCSFCIESLFMSVHKMIICSKMDSKHIFYIYRWDWDAMWKPHINCFCQFVLTGYIDKVIYILGSV